MDPIEGARWAADHRWASVREAHAQVRRWLGEQHEPVSTPEVAQRAGSDRKLVSRWLRVWEELGLVECVGRDRRGKLWVAADEGGARVS